MRNFLLAGAMILGCATPVAAAAVPVQAAVIAPSVTVQSATTGLDPGGDMYHHS